VGWRQGFWCSYSDCVVRRGWVVLPGMTWPAEGGCIRAFGWDGNGLGLLQGCCVSFCKRGRTQDVLDTMFPPWIRRTLGEIVNHA
jgi:hypothetical protein